MSEAVDTVKVPIDGLRPGHPILFTFQKREKTVEAFLVLHDLKVYAYINRCPHVSVSLDFGDGYLMDSTRKFIQCQVHGARFLPETGECFWGPPRGLELESLPVTVTPTHALVSVGASESLDV